VCEVGTRYEGLIKGPDDTNVLAAGPKLTKINFEEPERPATRAFENLDAWLLPRERLTMEVMANDQGPLRTRIIEIVSPIGKGQRLFDRGAAGLSLKRFCLKISPSIEKTTLSCIDRVC